MIINPKLEGIELHLFRMFYTMDPLPSWRQPDYDPHLTTGHLDSPHKSEGIGSHFFEYLLKSCNEEGEFKGIPKWDSSGRITHFEYIGKNPDQCLCIRIPFKRTMKLGVPDVIKKDRIFSAVKNERSSYRLRHVSE